MFKIYANGLRASCSMWFPSIRACLISPHHATENTENTDHDGWGWII